MMVLLHATGRFPDMQFGAPIWEGIKVYAVGELQDFASGLFRDPDAIGILHCHLPDIAPQIVRGMRQGDVRNRLFVLLSRRAGEEPWLSASYRAAALRFGADDCQPDDIDDREIVARLRAIVERGAYIDHMRIRLPGGTYLHDLRSIETDDGRKVRVPPLVGSVLVDLARHPGCTRTKAQIMDALYGGEEEPSAKIIDVLVCKLRQKVMEATGGLDVVRTNWGRGYQFEAAGFEPEMHVARRRAAP